MEVFGSFEATEVAREGNFGVIMYARKAGISDRKFAIKVFRPPEFLMDDDQIVREAESFLDSAEAQQRAHVAASGVWAPVYEMGKCQGGAWYATDLHEGSLEWLRITQRDLEPEHIRKVIEPIVQGLLALKVGQGRPHGNLKATNILLQGRADLSRARIFLCDPKPTARCKSPEDDQNDARDLGNVVHQLILHRQFQNATEWPLQNADAWKRLGKTGAAWLDFVNKLIDPTTTRKPTIQEIAAMLPGGPVAVPAGGKAASAGPSEAERKAAKEEADRKAKEEDERRKRNEAEIARKVREQAEKEAAAKAEADRKAKEEAQKKAEADARAREEAQRKAEADRKAREEADKKAREEAERKAKEDAERRARDAEAAKKAQEEAAQRAKEDDAKRQAERAEADRKAKEAAEKKAVEDADRKAKAEEERRAKEEEARKQAELKARQKAEQDAKERERLEAERKAKEEERKAKDDAKRQAQEEAEKKKAEATEAKERAAAEAAAARAAAVEAKKAQAQAKAQAASAGSATGDSSSTFNEPKPAGSKKGLVIAAAAVVALAGTVGVVMAMRGGGETPPGPVTPQPQPQPDPTAGTNTGTQDPPVPTPTAPSAQEIASAVTRRAGELESRIAEDIAVAARSAVDDHRRASTDRLTTIARAEAQRAVESASDQTPPPDVRTAALRAAEQVLTTAFAQGLNAPAPTRASRASLASIASDLSRTVLGDLAGADQSQVETASGNSVDQAVARMWQAALTSAADAARGEAISQLAGTAADGARSAFETRVAASNRTTQPPVQPQPEPQPEPQPDPQPDPPPTPPAITEADIASARAQVAAVATLLDGGSTVNAEGLAAARRQLQAAEGTKGFERIGTEAATERVRARLDAIDRIIAADAAGIVPLVQGASSQTGGPSELMAAWNRLGQVGQGVALPQLVEARTAAIAALGAFDGAVQPRARQIVDATTRQIWSAQAATAASEQAIEQIRASKDTLEIPDEGLPASYSFNIALMDLKTQIRAVSLTGDERLGVLKEPAQRFVQRVSSLAPIAQEQAVQNAIAWAGEIAAFTPGAAQPAGTGDLSRVGPGSVGWTKTAESADGQQVEYTIAAVGNRFREERLVFYRVGGAFLSASEVSIALFRRLFSETDSLEEIRGAYSDPATGLRAWRVNNRTVQLNEQLARSPDITNPQQLAAWGGRPATQLNPIQTWPVQSLNPRAAAVVAGKLGCRLPTLDEWRTAAQSESGQTANLRDSEWFEVLAAARAFRFVGAPIYPDAGAVKAEGARAQGPAAPDGYPFFAPVEGDGFGSRWKHLRGNVAEWVFMTPPSGVEPIVTAMTGVDAGWRFGVVGGSAVSPPSFASPDQVIEDHNNRPWFDVGLRLAFTAPGGVAVAPTPSPADGRVAELQGLAYLVAERR